MDALVKREFVLWYRRNKNVIPAGTILVHKGHGYYGFRWELGLLIEPDAVMRLVLNGYVVYLDSEADEFSVYCA